MKIAIIGGHFSPALAVVENLINDDVLYIGRKYALEGDRAVSLEYQIINSLGINFAIITTGRLQRKFTRHTIPSLFKFPQGLIQSYFILRKFKPDVVLGFGSYLSVPMVISAFYLKIPVVIHEQTLETGAANKYLARFAKKICISWESSEKFFPKSKAVLTGLPLRNEIIKAKENLSSQIAKEIPEIYVTGGNLGSHKINLLIENNLSRILTFAKVIHQTGDSRRFMDFDRLKSLKDKLPDNLKNRYDVKKFLAEKDLLEVLKNSDLIISRAGINSVAEIIYLEKPALLIPLSFSQRNEQKKNALMAKNLGLAEVLDEKTDLNNFMSILEKMLKNVKEYKLNKLNNVIELNSAERIIDVARSTVKK